MDKKGKDANKKLIEIEKSERAKRINDLLKILKTLYRDIRGRRENLSPIFIIGGVYNIKNPFFENRLKVEKNKLIIETIKDTLKMDEEIKVDKVNINSVVIKTKDNELINEINKKVRHYVN